MSHSSQPSKPMTWPWASFMENFSNPFGSFAPSSLTQPINPGWSFGNVISVTEQNSSAPDTERDIVSAESYGRQLGRLIDAMSELITELRPTAPRAKAFDDLIELRNRIDTIKSKAAARRLDRIVADLALLKENDPDEFHRVATTQRRALDRQP